MSNLLIDGKNFRIIDETNKYILGSLWEQAYLYNKADKTEILLCEFYGDCSIGVISDENDWCLVAGDIIAIWKNSKLTTIERDELKWINNIRIKNKDTVEILIDPWSNNSAIWELNIDNLCFKKISDFLLYKERLYTDKIDW